MAEPTELNGNTIDRKREVLIPSDKRERRGWSHLYVREDGNVAIQAVMPDGTIMALSRTTIALKTGQVAHVGVRVTADIDKPALALGGD